MQLLQQKFYQQLYVCYFSRYSIGVIPASRLKNLQKNEGLGKFIP